MVLHRIAYTALLVAILAAPAYAADEPAASAPVSAAVAAVAPAPVVFEGSTLPAAQLRKGDLPATALGRDKPPAEIDDQFEQYDASAVQLWWERYRASARSGQ